MRIAKRLKRVFFLQPTLEVAKALLGKYLIHKIGKRKTIGKIVETEAYIGPGDRASHAYQGKVTQRNRAEYMIGGYIYIYLVYGMYWQLNISTGKEGKPECVLIRAVEPIAPLNIKNKKSTPYLIRGKNTNQKLKNLSNGPGKLCRYLKINGKHYGLDVCTNKETWLEDGRDRIKPSQITAVKRVGIDYAGKYWTNKKWRFYIKDNPFVSKK